MSPPICAWERKYSVVKMRAFNTAVPLEPLPLLRSDLGFDCQTDSQLHCDYRKTMCVQRQCSSPVPCVPPQRLPVHHLTNRPLIPLLFRKWEMRKDLLNERHRMNAFMGWGLLWNTSEPFLSLALTLLFNTQKAITARFPKWQLSVSCCPKGRRDESCNLFPTSPLYLFLQIRRDGINGTTAKWCLWILD